MSLLCVFMWLTVYITSVLLCVFSLANIQCTCVYYHVCLYVANSVHVYIISVLLCVFSLANIQCTCVYYHVCLCVANSVHVCIISVLLCAFFLLTYSVHVIIMCVYVAYSVHQ